MPSEPVLFVAGATGAVGRTAVRLAQSRGIRFIPHVRPRRAAQGPLPPDAAVLELSDEDALAEVLGRCTVVLQLIGTMRKRFATGDTYETSDIGTTEQLVRAAKRAGIGHIVLLSAVGAGRPIGAYLKAKARAEAIVRESGIPFTIVRPSAFIGEGHRAPPGFAQLTRILGLARAQPIRVEDLASALLHVAVRGEPKNAVLEGDSLWQVVRASTPVPA